MITAYHLSDLLAIGETHVTIVCQRCDRRGRFRIDDFIMLHGDVVLPAVLTVVSGDCPGRQAATPRCSAIFEHPLTVAQEAAIKARREGRK